MNTPFELAVRQHGDTVLRVCRTVLGPGAVADDAWSETFLAALQAWPNLEEGTNLEAWLVRVAHNKAIDITRAHARRAVPTDDLPEQHSSIGNPEDAYSEVWRASPSFRNGSAGLLLITSSVATLTRFGVLLQMA